MSSDDKDTPPKKLSLSRDTKPAGESEKPATPPPAMKLKRKSEPDTAPPPEPVSVPKPQSEKLPVQEVSNTAPSTEGQEEKFDPKNPFGGSIKDNEIKESAPPPPPEESAPPTSQPVLKKKIPLKTDTGTKVEAAVASINQPQAAPEPEDSKGGKNNFLPSLLVILLLLGVLGGAGYGLWMVLQPSNSEELSEEAKPKGPIQKAKDAIAMANANEATAEEQIEAFSNITGSQGEEPAGQSSAPKAVAAALPQNTVAPQQPTSSGQGAVTEYLSSIHIGGMRQGSNPMIILDGAPYKPGETVQQSTGLKFDGFRDGKLAFRDAKGIVYLKSF